MNTFLYLFHNQASRHSPHTVHTHIATTLSVYHALVRPVFVCIIQFPFVPSKNFSQHDNQCDLPLRVYSMSQPHRPTFQTISRISSRELWTDRESRCDTRRGKDLLQGHHPITCRPECNGAGAACSNGSDVYPKSHFAFSRDGNRFPCGTTWTASSSLIPAINLSPPRPT